MNEAILPHAAALRQAGVALASGGRAGQPLCIIDDATDCQEILRHAVTADGDRRAGIRTLRTMELLTPLPAGAGRDLPLLATIDRNQDVRNNAANVALLARIYVFLRQESGLDNPLALATAYRDILAEMNLNQAGTRATLPELVRQHSPYTAEITWLHQLWEQFCEPVQREQQARLAALATSLEAPVVHVHWRAHTPHLLQEFLVAAATTTTVTKLGIRLDGLAADLAQLWEGGKPEALDLGGRDCEFHATGTIEQAAAAALTLLGKWRHAGKKRIGVVGFNRQLVRRLHSLCLQHGILMVDRAGWLAKNLLVGDVLLALTDPTRDQVTRLRLLQLQARQLNGNHAGSWVWPARAVQAGAGDTAATAMEGLLAGWGGLAGAQEPANWFAKLAEVVQQAPLAEFFADDLAAEKLYRQLYFLSQAFAGDEWEKMGPGELHRLLLDALTSMHLRTSEVHSDIQLVQPAQLSTQRFDALLLLGADASSLPEVRHASLFNNNVREALGLPSQWVRTADLRLATANRLAIHECFAAIWHGHQGISPYFEMLEPQLDQSPWQPPAQPAWQIDAAGTETLAEHEVVAGHRMPTRLSPSNYDTLMACPYKFYADKFLRLREDTTDGQNNYHAIEFGTFVHNVLEEFHRRKMADGQPGGDNRTALREATAAYLARQDAGMGNPTVYAWVWEPLSDAYAARMDEFYAAGHCIVSCEEKVLGEMVVGGQPLEVSFVCDRVDESLRQSKAVMDIKTGNIDKAMIAKGEKPQLALYACLTQGSVPELAEIWKLNSSRGEHEVQRLQPFHQQLSDVHFTAVEIFLHLQKVVLAGIRANQPLPANGAPTTCKHCSFAGLCRRPFWQVAPTEQP